MFLLCHGQKPFYIATASGPYADIIVFVALGGNWIRILAKVSVNCIPSGKFAYPIFFKKEICTDHRLGRYNNYNVKI